MGIKKRRETGTPMRESDKGRKSEEKDGDKGMVS